jgi:hypothetical protein
MFFTRIWCHSIINVNKRKLRTQYQSCSLEELLLYQFTNIGIIKAVVIEPGINNKPASVAVHPKMDCVYIGIINVEPYKPKPSMKAIRVPILKFRL